MGEEEKKYESPHACAEQHADPSHPRLLTRGHVSVQSWAQSRRPGAILFSDVSRLPGKRVPLN